MDRKVFIAILLAIVLVGLVALTFAILRPFLLAMLWAAAITSVSYGPYRRLLARLKGRPNRAAAGMTCAVLVVILTPFALISVSVFEDAAGLARDVSPDRVGTRLQSVLSHPRVQSVIDWMYETGGTDEGRRQALEELGRQASGPLVAWVRDALAFLVSLVVGIVSVTIATFYFYRDGPHVLRFVRELMPLSEDTRDTIIDDLHGATIAAVRGGLLTALAQGGLGLIILIVLDVEHALLWAAAMALASLLPVLGSALVWVPLAFVMVAKGQLTEPLILAAYGLLVIGLADNVLRPILVGRHMHAHPMLLFFGTMGGIAMFGFAGIILGPIAVALVTVAARLFRREITPPSSDSPAPAPAPPSPEP